MSFLKKGPEIKLSELKVPGFVEDVYHDLKDRHLLPLAALLLVAIVAVPFLLSQSSETEPPGAAGSGASASGAGGGDAMVARSTPSLRDYRKRLDGQTARDPFKPREGSQQAASATPASPSPTSPESSYEGGSGFSSGSGGSSSSSSPSPSDYKLTYFSHAIDVRVTAGNGEPRVRKNLPPMTMLPGRETPALIYMGASADGKKAMMLVSSDVDAIFGDAKCILGSKSCDLLALETGLPTTIVYGGEQKTFKLELLTIRLVESDKVNKAPLGKPKQGKGSKGQGKGSGARQNRLAGQDRIGADAISQGDEG